jgi:2-oxoglutarate dehydrogenase E2 component (dihydrolipoamide succinyltransferase)
MSDRILVPVLGESVTEATVAKWLKNEGDKISADEPVVELETDKVNVEVPAPSNGTLDKISVKEGQTVNVGALLGIISSSKSSTVNTSVEEKKYSPPPKKLEVVKNIEAPQEKKKRINRRAFNFN